MCYDVSREREKEREETSLLFSSTFRTRHPTKLFSIPIRDTLRPAISAAHPLYPRSKRPTVLSVRGPLERYPLDRASDFVTATARCKTKATRLTRTPATLDSIVQKFVEFETGWIKSERRDRYCPSVV